MMKNSNKKAGNWGALKNKPQNQVYFKAGGKVKVTAGGEKHVIYKKTTKRGEGKVGNIMVNHPTKDKGVWDTIDLTKKSGAKTIKQGIASTRKWHKENPYNDMKKQVAKKQNGGAMKKGSPTPPMMSPYMDRATKAKMNSPKTKAIGDQFKNTPPTGKNPLKTGVYKGTKLTPAQIKQSQEDWKKKEKEKTNPNNKKAGSALTPLKRGGSVKKYQNGGPSYMDKVKGVAAGIKANTKSEPATRKDALNMIDYYETQNARYGDIDYLNRAKNDKTSSELMKEVRYGLSPAKAARLAVKKGEENAKFKRARVPSDVLGEKPKYLKKTGGAIKKKK